MDKTDHYERANQILDEWCKPVSTTAEAAAVGQVHAILALVDVLARVADATELLLGGLDDIAEAIEPGDR